MACGQRVHGAGLTTMLPPDPTHPPPGHSLSPAFSASSGP